MRKRGRFARGWNGPLLLSALGAAAAGAGTSGCLFTTDHRVATVEEQGALTVQWSIAGSFDPEKCDTYGAKSFKLEVADRAGVVQRRAIESCSEFVLTLELPEGTYRARAGLVDDEGKDVSSELPLSDLRIERRTELAVDIDFPSGSMLVKPEER